MTNQLKTRPAPEETAMYARVEKSAQKMRERSGRPPLVTFVKILGALPERARPSKKIAMSNE